jgi:hypothetical protein
LQNTGLPKDPVDPHEIDPDYNGFSIDMGDDDDEADEEGTVNDDNDDHIDDDQDNDDDDADPRPSGRDPRRIDLHNCAKMEQLSGFSL